MTGSAPPVPRRLRLRHKLALSLSVAALLPVLVVSWVAVGVVLESLNQGLRDETEQQLQVGLSLVLRTVERMGADAMRLSAASDLALAMEALAHDQAGARAQVQELVDRARPHLPSSLVQILDSRGHPAAEAVVGNVESRFTSLRVHPTSEPVRAGLAYESRVTIEAVAGMLVVRATAPVLDPSFRLLGVVILSVPLDGPFADEVKGALGTDVLIFAGIGDAVTPALSTFVDATGGRERGIEINTDIATRVQAGESVLSTETIFGRQYAVGYTPLINLHGERVGIFAVAVDRAPLSTAKSAATHSLALGAAGAFGFALLLAGLLSRRLTGPLQRLVRGARAVARGELDHRINVSEGDELGDVAAAFAHMTHALQENQERLAARMREIVALHDAGRAMSSVINLDHVLSTIVACVARVFEVRLCVIWLVSEPEGEPVLELGAAWAKPSRRAATIHGEVVAEPLRSIAAEIAATRATLRIERAADDPARRAAAVAAGIAGSLLATPLERKGTIIGVLIIGRGRGQGSDEPVRSFTEADASLLATFADQAAAAIENARLYEEVRAFSEKLERKVHQRTAELVHMNAELGRTVSELRETQAQLVLSERMAGLGLLVAGMAHEINSPSASIAGAVGSLADNVLRFTEHTLALSALELPQAGARAFVDAVAAAGPGLAARHLRPPAEVRRAARALAAELEPAGLSPEPARTAALRLAELGASDGLVSSIVTLIGHGRGEQAQPSRDHDAACASDLDSDSAHASVGARVLTGYLAEYVFLHRNTQTIGNAIQRIQRIVRSLKAYSHLDQQASRVEADLHEGIEDTLVILDYVLRDINVVRNYGELPRVPVFVDELNQVWTNLIHNAAQALQCQGQITIETGMDEHGRGVTVRVIDDGPGIAPEVLPRIFEPFFTTKAKGEGTGLGLGIVRQIVHKHHGEVTCESRPGHTCFTVWMPLEQPRTPARPGHEAREPGDSQGAMS